MANTSSELMMRTITEIVEYANNTGSVNLYMAHGGTNFGYWAGRYACLYRLALANNQRIRTEDMLFCLLALSPGGLQ